MFVPLTAYLSIIYINTFHQGKQCGSSKPLVQYGAGELSVIVETCYRHSDKIPQKHVIIQICLYDTWKGGIHNYGRPFIVFEAPARHKIIFKSCNFVSMFECKCIVINLYQTV